MLIRDVQTRLPDPSVGVFGHTRGWACTPLRGELEENRGEQAPYPFEGRGRHLATHDLRLQIGDVLCMFQHPFVRI